MTATARKVRYREYETIYLMKPDVSKDAAAKIAQRIDDVVKREDARLVTVETWGRRQLSFSVVKARGKPLALPISVACTALVSATSRV